MYQAPNETGTPTRVTSSGVSTLGAGGPVALIGIFVPGALTAQIVSLWTQTAGSVTGTRVLGQATLAANAFYRIPAYFGSGLTYAVTAENPDLTFFWNPAD